MSNSVKNSDPAFQGVGQRVGTEIWRIENFQPVPLAKSDYGKFYSGDSYIVLQTTPGKGGAYLYDIHFWIGQDTSQDEAGTAAIKTVELDAVLGGRAVQHRELQGYESDKFLSYFKPCIIPLEGGFASGFKKPEEEKFETRLYICRGKRVVRMKQVPFARSSLNHDDVFILDTIKKIYQFNGANSNIQERAKALEVIQHLKDKYHEGKCDVAIIDDGKLVAESDSGEFWVLFGGFAPIGKKTISEDDVVPEATPAKLYSIDDGQLKLEEDTLSKALLENNKCYLLDCGSEIFVWVGRVTQVEDRKAASKAAEEFIANENRSKATRISQIIQGHEPHSFKSKFELWPVGTGTGNSGGEDGRGKVAALLKQQGVDVKGISKNSPINEEVPPLLESGGKLEVWRINGSAKTPVPKEEIGKFYSGDCYIVLYTYHSGEKKEEYFLSCWMGKDSVQNDQMMSTRLANTMWNSLKGRPVQGRIIEGKEPPQFIALFQPMIVLKGGISSGYKKFIAEKNLNDETYTSDGIALIRVSGTSVHNNKAVQVDAVSKSLSSTDCFLLQSGNSLFTWHGNSTTFEQQQWAAKVAEFLKPGVVLKHVKEGTESSAFWFALGGKQNFTTKKLTQDIIRDPHLYTFSFNEGKLEVCSLILHYFVTEVYNFSQDDLLTEDILILDTQAEVFVWVGQSVDSKEKQKAFDIGHKYIELAASLEGLSPDLPLYKVTEGNEPCFFTTYFSWDGPKAMAQGNSFQKKLSLLVGTAVQASESNDKSNNSNHSGPTQRASALAALSSAFNPSSKTKTGAPKPSRSGQGSQRAAAVAALSSVLTAEQRKRSDTSPARISRSPSPGPDTTASDTVKTKSASTEVRNPEEISTEKEAVEGDRSITESNGADSEVIQDLKMDEDGGQSTFNYERLKAKSSNPIRGIDYKRREAYLSDAEFQTVLGMTKEAFYRQPKWKQDMQKRKVDLF
ncbi:villin-2 isoform X1 [Phoenix dactylifera]|uniref:Villin-2 isoform X1 n=1 Tax=Phoenix dactylifera TaxID=42345 RepID=A0A8B9APQ7_PHODC|nr:villin-2 isoform X1 [Phoenix dactylifera]XP_038988757.1 villin-2 isoform X1 [Phoenix dactylifera]